MRHVHKNNRFIAHGGYLISINKPMLRFVRFPDVRFLGRVSKIIPAIWQKAFLKHALVLHPDRN